MKKIFIGLLVFTMAFNAIPVLASPSESEIEVNRKNAILSNEPIRYRANQLHYEVRDPNSDKILEEGNLGSIVKSTDKFIIDGSETGTVLSIMPNTKIVIYPENTQGFYMWKNMQYMFYLHTKNSDDKLLLMTDYSLPGKTEMYHENSEVVTGSFMKVYTLATLNGYYKITIRSMGFSQVDLDCFNFVQYYPD